MSSINGLTLVEMKQFEDLLTKANNIQLRQLWLSTQSHIRSRIERNTYP